MCARAAWKSAGNPPASILLVEGVDIQALDKADDDPHLLAEDYLEALLETEDKPIRWRLLRAISVAIAEYGLPEHAQSVSSCVLFVSDVSNISSDQPWRCGLRQRTSRSDGACCARSAWPSQNTACQSTRRA